MSDHKDSGGTPRQVYAPRNGDKSILQRSSADYATLQIVGDIVICLATLYLLAYAKGVELELQYRTLMALSALLTIIFYNAFGVYRRSLGVTGVFTQLIKAWGAVVLSLILMLFVTKTSIYYSRQIILLWVVATFLLQFSAHILLLKAVRRYRKKSEWKEKAILVGAGDLAKYLAGYINSDPWLPFQIVGVADDNEEALLTWQAPDIALIGGLDEIHQFINEQNVRKVFMALPLNSSANIERLYIDLLATNLDVSWVPDIFGLTLINPNVKEIAGVPIFALSETPLIGSRALAKSAVDKILAILAIMITSPIMIATAVAIKATSPGPLLFRQKRHGWNGAEIDVLKFRSMREHEESEGMVSQATQDDPRITTVGRFIRRTSIDELPQLFNVLQGTMSMVGPRPHAVEHNNYYSELIHTYFARHKIKPGITGLAQVKGFRGETKTLEKMEKRVECDLEYINNWSVALDLKILTQTIFVLFSKEAY